MTDKTQQKAKQGKKQKPKARYGDYIDLALHELGEIRRDVFSGDLHCKIDGKWVPVLGENCLGHLKSMCRDNEFYQVGAVEDHLLRFTRSEVPKPLFDVPDWDGGERLDEIGKSLRVENVSQAHATELLKDWGARMFRRLYDPVIQNRILVLKGPQGCGKDYLVSQMLGYLGDFISPWVTFSQEKDTFDLISSSLVMHISEYDRIYKADVAALKNYITLNRVRYRGSYARKAENKSVRTSFIATCNVDQILRDWTGNRRYIIFDLSGIDWTYPLGDSAQILAEWRKLSSDGYRASPEAEAAMKDYILGQTPGDPEAELLEDYEGLFARRHYGEARVKASEMTDTLKELSQLHKITVHQIRCALRRKDYGGRTRVGTEYGGKPGAWRANEWVNGEAREGVENEPEIDDQTALFDLDEEVF